MSFFSFSLGLDAAVVDVPRWRVNPSLHFKLRDSVLSLQQLRTWAHETLHSQEQLRENLPTKLSIAKTTLAYIIKTLEVLDLGAVPRSLTLAVIADVLYWRSTSRPEAETMLSPA